MNLTLYEAHTINDYQDKVSHPVPKIPSNFINLINFMNFTN